MAASQQQREGRRGEETGGNGSLNSALKQEATPVLSLLCFYRLNFLPARPPLVATVTIPGAYRGCRRGDGKDRSFSLSHVFSGERSAEYLCRKKKRKRGRPKVFRCEISVRKLQGSVPHPKKQKKKGKSFCNSREAKIYICSLIFPRPRVKFQAAA